MKNGIIKLDSKNGKQFGFTKDKFSGWLWKHNQFIWISFIESLQPHKGNLKQLFDTIEEKGYNIIVPTPFPRMKSICFKRGMKYTHIESDGEIVKCLVNKKTFNLLKDG